MTMLWPAAPRWSSLDQLTADTAAFEFSWWRNDPDVAAVCASDADLRDRLDGLAATGIVVQTTDVYRNSVGECRTERAALHAQLAEWSRLGTPAPHTLPIAHVTIGCPGAGKTTLLGPLAHTHRGMIGGSTTDVVVVDADGVRRALPEYADGLGSQVVQEECCHISYDLVYEQARQAGIDLVFDTMGRRGTTEVVIEQLLAAGYSVHILLAEAPLAMCQERAKLRALHDGRLVPPSLQELMHREGRLTYQAMTDGHLALAGWAVVDTRMETGSLGLLESGGAWADVGGEVIRVTTL